MNSLKPYFVMPIVVAIIMVLFLTIIPMVAVFKLVNTGFEIYTSQTAEQ